MLNRDASARRVADSFTMTTRRPSSLPSLNMKGHRAGAQPRLATHVLRFDTGFLERGETPQRCAVREVKEELNLDAGAPTLIGVYAFERMNQVIIGYHVTATGTIALNDELDDYKLIAPERCKVWPAGTGFALRDWLRSKGHEPEMLQLPAPQGRQ